MMNKVILYLIFFISITASAQNNPAASQHNEKCDTLKFYKKNAHASYYSDKFNGRKTASGKKFDNNKLTAAHKTFPFGTKLKITNETNNKYVVVEVIDRGPFVKGREIDLSKKAFMDITSNKGSGVANVSIEIVKK